MNPKKISRRSALGVIGKTGAALGAGTYFFLTLKTAPLHGSIDGVPEQDPGRAQKTLPKPGLRPAEKVVISGSGSKLIVKISGPPGRHYAVVYATADSAEAYKPLLDARSYIGENGLGTVGIDVKGLPNGKIFLRVVTGSSSDFAQDRRGTEAFTITMANGAVSTFGGVRERPLRGTTAVASLAAACLGTKVR